jgi:formate hydrogenlyase subunit 6/NADH:ubiquinone oxidoreductase subunit I
MEMQADAVKVEAETAERIPIYIMGKRYDVPSSLTIQKAMEFAGYQLIRGCGCRGGICGACATVFRFPGDHRVQVGLACQTVVQPNMFLTQLPFFPGNKATYDIDQLEPTGSTIADLYPEIFKCVGCNTCTRGCPMDIDVMEYVNRAIRGDVEGVAEVSFDCVMCGICSARCPAEEVQYNVGILARRLYGRHIAPKSKHLEEQCNKIRDHYFDDMLKELMEAQEDKLKELYLAREREPDLAEEFWEPQDKTHL